MLWLDRLKYCSEQEYWKEKINHDIKRKYSLSDFEIFIIQNYIGFNDGQASDHDYINNYLRMKDTPRDKESMIEVIKILQNAIQKFSSNTKKVYRIVKSSIDNNDIFQEMLQKRIRKDDAFMSCTYNKNYINNAKNNNRSQIYVLEIINANYYQKGYDISELSIPYKKTCKRTEEEVIFLPGFEGEIKDIKREGNVTHITL